MHVNCLIKALINTVLLSTVVALSTTVFADDKAPDFILGKTAKNQTVYLSSYKGRVVYLDFWASWCVPCLKSFPWMNEMHNRYKKNGLKILAVNVDEQKDEAKKFLKDHPADFTVIYDFEAKIAEKYEVKAMPSSYFIDRKGNIVKTKLGFKIKDTDEMEQVIQSLLK